LDSSEKLIVKIFAKTITIALSFYKKQYFWEIKMKKFNSTYHSSITTQIWVALAVTTTSTTTTTP